MHQHTDVMSQQLIYVLLLVHQEMLIFSPPTVWQCKYLPWDTMGLDVYIFQFESWCVSFE